jgi:hypothetical protein
VWRAPAAAAEEPRREPTLIDEVGCCIQVCRFRLMAKTTSALSAAATGSGVMQLKNLVKRELRPMAGLPKIMSTRVVEKGC